MNRISILLPLLLCSAGTSFTKEEAASGNKTLISVDGKPYLTELDFEEFLNQVVESEPQLSIYMQMDPDGIRSQLLEAKKREAVMNEWAKKNKVTESDSYKKRRKIGEDALHSMLVHQEFVEKHKSDPTDADARKYYEEHKDKDPNLGTPGGKKAKAVRFTSESDAKAFDKKLSADKHDIDKTAKNEKDAKVQDLGVISEAGFSFVDPAIKEKVLKHKKFPVSDVIKLNDQEFWVVVTSGEQKAEYEAFENVKDAIKQQLAGKKVEEMFEAKIPQYEKEYKIKAHKQNMKKQGADAAQQGGAAKPVKPMHASSM